MLVSSGNGGPPPEPTPAFPGVVSGEVTPPFSPGIDDAPGAMLLAMLGAPFKLFGGPPSTPELPWRLPWLRIPAPGLKLVVILVSYGAEPTPAGEEYPPP